MKKKKIYIINCKKSILLIIIYYIPQVKFTYYKKSLPRYSNEAPASSEQAPRDLHTQTARTERSQKDFFKSSSLCSCKVLNATLLIKANYGVQIKKTPPLPKRKCFKYVKQNLKQVKYKKLKSKYTVKYLKFHWTHGRMGDVKPKGLAPRATCNADHKAAGGQNSLLLSAVSRLSCPCSLPAPTAREA